MIFVIWGGLSRGKLPLFLSLAGSMDKQWPTEPENRMHITETHQKVDPRVVSEPWSLVLRERCDAHSYNQKRSHLLRSFASQSTLFSVENPGSGHRDTAQVLVWVPPKPQNTEVYFVYLWGGGGELQLQKKLIQCKKFCAVDPKDKLQTFVKIPCLFQDDICP